MQIDQRGPLAIERGRPLGPELKLSGQCPLLVLQLSAATLLAPTALG